MDNRIKKILIVGGGTSGWLAAGYLRRALGDTVEITLLESSSVSIIGVGEATIPTFQKTMEFIGFSEEEWMPRVNATFKSAIQYVNWVDAPQPGRDGYYWHPFPDYPDPLAQPYGKPWFVSIGEGASLIHYALRKKLRGEADSIAEQICPTAALCEEMKSPRSYEDPSLKVRYAHHMDAGLIGGFLRERLTAQGVKHVVDHVVDVQLDERGFIYQVNTEGGRQLTADFFIDCTGFRGVLIHQALGAPYISDNDALLCNSAVAISCRNNPEEEGIKPYVVATALRHGWAWDIPLFNRNGCGYVYSNHHVEKQKAEAELRRFLGPRCDGMPANHIKMRVGRAEVPWVKNCIALGLASSFIEPLESTTIFLTEVALGLLVTLFPDKNFDAGRIKTYNRTMSSLYEEVRDFVVLHYILTNREDTAFWRDVRHETKVPASLQEKLDAFQHNLPVMDGFQASLFRAPSYACVLDGYNKAPKHPYPLLEHAGYDAGNEILGKIKSRTEYLRKELPTHYEYLAQMYEAAGAMPEPVAC